MKKIKLSIIFLFILIAFLGMQSIPLPLSNTFFETHEKIKSSQETTLIIGVPNGPYTIDPHDAWDSSSFNVIEQVCEGLFAYNYSHPDKEIIPRLALDYGVWSNNGLNYTVSLKQDILFHDGNPFNATAVKWNFNRLAFLMNVSGDFSGPGNPANIDPVYRWLDGTPFINRTEEIDLYTIRFILNKPFGGFEALLCFSGSYILSPASTPSTTFIDVLSGDLIGTGPFVYDKYNADDNVNFHSFNAYWRTDSKIQGLTLKIFPDSLSLTQALINEEIDILLSPSPRYFDNITNTEHLKLTESKKGGWVIHFLGINNNLIDRSFREAISYAFNCSYIIEHLKEGHAERLKSPIPKSMLYSNYSYDIPIYNISKAREIMQSMGYGLTLDPTYPGFNETEWTTANFRTLNYTYNKGNTFREQIGNLLIDNLGKIGIKVETYNFTWDIIMGILYEDYGYSRNNLELFFLGWGADYNDPSQFINVLFSNSSDSNSAQYNGGYGGFLPYDQENDVELLMEQAITSIDKDERIILYNKIQQLLIERDFPWVFVYSPKGYIAYHKDLEGIENNAFISIDEDDKSSVKGDFQLISWKYVSITPAIPGYQIFFIILIALLSVIYTIKFRHFKSKK